MEWGWSRRRSKAQRAKASNGAASGTTWSPISSIQVRSPTGAKPMRRYIAWVRSATATMTWVVPCASPRPAAILNSVAMMSRRWRQRRRTASMLAQPSEGGRPPGREASSTSERR